MRHRKIFGRVKMRKLPCPFCGSYRLHSIVECLPAEMNPRYWEMEERDVTPYGIRDEYGGL